MSGSCGVEDENRLIELFDDAGRRGDLSTLIDELGGMRDVFNNVSGDERTKLRRVMEQRGVQAPQRRRHRARQLRQDAGAHAVDADLLTRADPNAGRAKVAAVLEALAEVVRRFVKLMGRHAHFAPALGEHEAAALAALAAVRSGPGWLVLDASLLPKIGGDPVGATQAPLAAVAEPGVLRRVEHAGKYVSCRLAGEAPVRAAVVEVLAVWERTPRALRRVRSLDTWRSPAWRAVPEPIGHGYELRDQYEAIEEALVESIRWRETSSRSRGREKQSSRCRDGAKRVGQHGEVTTRGAYDVADGRKRSWPHSARMIRAE